MKLFITICIFFIFNINTAQTNMGDDGLHFAAGALISGASYTIIYKITKNKKKAFWYSLGLSTLAGLSKEIYDENFVKGKFNTGEVLATFAGGLTASYTLNIFTGKRKRKRKEELLAFSL